MRRERYESEKHATAASAKQWRAAALGLLAANLVLATTVAGWDMTEKTRLVPPALEKAIWFKGEEVAPEYLEEMTRYLSGLVLNVTPQSVDGNIDVFLRYVAPEAYGDIRARMQVRADRLKRDTISTVFYPVDYQTKTKKGQVVIAGDFASFIGSKPVAPVRRSWRFTYAFESDGRLRVTEFVEVDREHPFDTAIGDAADPAVGQ